MKLQEAKEKVAVNNGWNSWRDLMDSRRLRQESKYLLFDMAAILYAREKFDEAIAEMRAISDIDSDCELPTFEP